MKKKKFKKIQMTRFVVQMMGVILTITGLFINESITSIVLIGLTLLAGPVFCGWICPYGFMQDLLSKIGRFLDIRKRKMPKSIHKILQFSRYILLAFVLLVSTDLVFSIMSNDPRTNLQTILMGGAVVSFGWVILIGFLVVSLFFERPFCNYLCTEGARYGLFSILRPFTVKRNEHSCISCGKCDKVCPMNIQVSEHNQVRSLHCINCFECVESCPVKNTLSVGVSLVDIKDKKVWMPLVAAFVVFIGVMAYNNIEGIQGSTTNITTTQSSATETPTTQSSATETPTTQSSATETPTTQSSASETPTTQSSTTAATTTEVIVEEAAQDYGDAAGIVDGVYSGSGTGFKGRTTVVDVTVSNQLITEIVVTKTGDDAKWFNRALSYMVSGIIDAQSTDVDTVSGATYSSEGIRDAVADALDNAQ